MFSSSVQWNKKYLRKFYLKILFFAGKRHWQLFCEKNFSIYFPLPSLRNAFRSIVVVLTVHIVCMQMCRSKSLILSA